MRKLTSTQSLSSRRKNSEKIRYAVVGLGWIAQDAILPAFSHAKSNSTLAALVSGDEKKRRILGKHYGVPTYAYEQYDELLGSGGIDAVYIALPNSLHREYAVRAANAKVHVLSEKPLAVYPEEAQEMITACHENRIKLMTAYRLHFDPISKSFKRSTNPLALERALR